MDRKGALLIQIKFDHGSGNRRSVTSPFHANEQGSYSHLSATHLRFHH
jgi:hypothetical protein